ncbi:RagB/SusD family nutrient uptake outer membrane protein [Dysgonomonas macrotermitis]|uniref:SusD family protein n=1 Tax=Dysgonomonas macrotermitis TaxID=1346286 RepID=A0A1M4T428_9BACT|nr:RagB/SusD family nutrient uptake outer membrane protein [Dysgonomonas macrotermitis]SHE39223.1 SusD family protein [Dysgonomonas macrotermitis]
MKNLKYLAIGAVALLFSSCESFLDTENYTEKNTSNYPQTLADAQQVLAGIYNNLSVVNANPQYSFHMVSELASDDRFGGGGSGDRLLQAIDLMMSTGTDMMRQFWLDRYVGIQRANNAIETLGNCTGYNSEDQKNKMIGEAYFFRAFYYYELASLFENVPLIVSTAGDGTITPQADPNDTWAQIISDLKTAIEMMPAQKTSSSEAGHVDKYTAEALMGRAFLFYTGFYKKTDVTLPDGSTVTQSDVIGWIDDCVNNSGYSLVPDYRNLWAYTNELTKNDYSYTKGQNLRWVEDNNAINPESMFAIKYSKFASWDTTIGYSNGYALFFGMRGGQELGNTFPFGQGWGAGPVSPGLWSEWGSAEPTDMRRRATICNIPEEVPGYTKGGWTDFVQETDYYDKKGAPISSKKADGSGYWETFEQDMYDYTTVNFQLSNIHDLVLIRFADVLLMQSELKKDVSGINKVRARAGLDPISAYSDDALRKERRWELAFEGTRWNDIRRWHIAETALTVQNNQATYFQGLADRNTTVNNGGGYAARYNATNGGFFPIPESEIALSEGVYKQNTGWESGTLYSGWR